MSSDCTTEQHQQGCSGWRALCDAARAGDRDALGQLCERLRPQLLRLADQDLGRDLAAKISPSDVVQKSLLEGAAAFEQFRGGTEAEFRAWMIRVLSNNLVDVARRYRLSRKRSIGCEVPIDIVERQNRLRGTARSVSSIVRRRETNQTLIDAVNLLSNRQREILELRFRDGLGHAEIGNRLSISEVAARKSLARALARLRILMSGQEHVVRPNRPR